MTPKQEATIGAQMQALAASEGHKRAFPQARQKSDAPTCKECGKYITRGSKTGLCGYHARAASARRFREGTRK